MKIGKLVRDKIPEIIERNGKKPIYRILDDAEYKEALEKKLDEEVAEWHKSQSLEELADVLEVVYALCKAHGYTILELHTTCESKFNERGAFNLRVFLEEVKEND